MQPVSTGHGPASRTAAHRRPAVRARQAKTQARHPDRAGRPGSRRGRSPTGPSRLTHLLLSSDPPPVSCCESCAGSCVRPRPPATGFAAGGFAASRSPARCLRARPRGAGAQVSDPRRQRRRQPSPARARRRRDVRWNGIATAGGVQDHRLPARSGFHAGAAGGDRPGVRDLEHDRERAAERSRRRGLRSRNRRSARDRPCARARAFPACARATRRIRASSTPTRTPSSVPNPDRTTLARNVEPPTVVSSPVPACPRA